MKETPFALISPSPYPRQLSTHLATLSTTSSTKTTLPVGKYMETSHLKLFTLQTLRILTPLLSTTHSLCSCLLTLQPTLPGTPAPVTSTVTFTYHQMHPSGPNGNLRPGQCFAFASSSAGTDQYESIIFYLSWPPSGIPVILFSSQSRFCDVQMKRLPHTF